MVTLTGTLLQPRSSDQCDVVPGTSLTIGDDGKIATVGTEPSGAGERAGGDGCWILPGFIDAHVHLPQWDCRGLDGLTLFDWQAYMEAYPQTGMESRSAISVPRVRSSGTLRPVRIRHAVMRSVQLRRRSSRVGSSTRRGPNGDTSSRWSCPMGMGSVWGMTSVTSASPWARCARSRWPLTVSASS